MGGLGILIKLVFSACGVIASAKTCLTCARQLGLI